MSQFSAIMEVFKIKWVTYQNDYYLKVNVPSNLMPHNQFHL